MLVKLFYDRLKPFFFFLFLFDFPFLNAHLSLSSSLFFASLGTAKCIAAICSSILGTTVLQLNLDSAPEACFQKTSLAFCPELSSERKIQVLSFPAQIIAIFVPASAFFSSVVLGQLATGSFITANVWTGVGRNTLSTHVASKNIKTPVISLKCFECICVFCYFRH